MKLERTSYRVHVMNNNDAVCNDADGREGDKKRRKHCNIYLCRLELPQSGFYFWSGDKESLHYYLTSCRRCSGTGNQILVRVLKLELKFSVTTISSFRADTLSLRRASLADGLHQYICENDRLDC